MDKVFLFSDKTFCCAEENNEDSDVFKAKFVVSDFSTNRNKCKLNRKTIVNWMNTLINKPLVGKLTSSYSGESDFTGHNLKTVVKEDGDGNRYKTTEFDTQAFGVFTDVGIEKIDDDECIVASCDIWKRFPKACEVIMKRIEDGVLNTSWEIGISESHKVMENGVPVKIIDNGTFLGHCLLGKNVTPAYDCSRALEIAEADLKLRGYGDLEGTRQSGDGIDLKIANLASDGQILQIARDMAIKVLDEDPELMSETYRILNERLKILFANKLNWRLIS